VWIESGFGKSTGHSRSAERRGEFAKKPARGMGRKSDLLPEASIGMGKVGENNDL